MKRQCPDCRSSMVFNEQQSAWTETKDLVVIPMVCPSCGYTLSKHITVSPDPPYEVFTKRVDEGVLHLLRVGKSWHCWTPLFGWQEYTGKKGRLTKLKLIPGFVSFKVKELLGEM